MTVTPLDLILYCGQPTYIYRMIHYTIGGLKYATEYTITVTAENGVSDQDPKNEYLRRCELRLNTREGSKPKLKINCP